MATVTGPDACESYKGKGWTRLKKSIVVGLLKPCKSRHGTGRKKIGKQGAG